MTSDSVTLWHCCACGRDGTAIHDTDSPLTDVVHVLDDEHFRAHAGCAERNGVAFLQIEFRVRRRRGLPDRTGLR